MSRTRRNTEHANVNARRIRHHNRRKMEEKALREIQEELGTNFVSNRLRSWQSIPTNYEDLPVSGYDENYNG